MKIRIDDGQCVIYEVPGVGISYYIMVNKDNKMMVNTDFVCPIVYLGKSIEDVEKFYSKHQNDLVFDGEFKEEDYQPISVGIFQR